LPNLEVALATFNGERFLAPLLGSLLEQTWQDFTILIADDGSSDSTMAIVGDYARRHPGRIRIVADGPHLGIVGNFARLLRAATADYLMPCDQDDVWLPRKIELSLARMRRLEADHGTETPLLVHTDLMVVAEDLRLLGPSYARYVGLDPARRLLGPLLLRNVVTGCTAMLNRALYCRARPIPADAIMHDHWIALVAAATGKIGFLDEPTVLYRQHAGNAIGARPAGAASTIERVVETLFTGHRQKLLAGLSRQAAALVGRFGDDLAPEDVRPAKTLAGLLSMPWWIRARQMRRSGLALPGFARTAALFFVAARGSARTSS
jgi:hypothetical protein